MMNKRRITLLMISVIVIMTIIAMIIPNKVSAAELPNTPVYFGINFLRENSGKNNTERIGYTLGDTLIDGTRRVTIWEINTYQNSEVSSGESGDYYCIREGKAFSETVKRLQYQDKYDFTKLESMPNIEEISKLKNNKKYYSLYNKV